ncbi:uncharacterized protein [Gossypium hirsutum]|uniref:Retrotransposon gag domain-containing protein n=1 Tax=Gossypium hirsutum TaxID=3635 RepID=A0ABM2ZQ00_GOSHI|nr:uncharacterized protein LOC107907856 [Gossypium hirsutum]
MSNEHVEDVDQEMYIRDRELDETESATPSVNPLGNQPNIERENVRDRDNSHLLRIIADALQRVAGTGIDPSTTENWMESTKRVLQQLECTRRESLICAVSLLQGEAYLWWESVIRHLPTEQVTWDLFQKEFQKKYVGELYIEDKRQEFLMLKQGNLSVVDYEREFSRLSRYASEFIPTEADSCKRFLRGLRDEIRVQLASHRITEFIDLVERAKMVEQVLGLDKKPEIARSTGKRASITISNPLPKRSRESRGGWR